MKLLYYIVILIFLATINYRLKNPDDFSISADKNRVLLKSGILAQTVICKGNNTATGQIFLNGKRINDEISDELQVTMWKATPDKEPAGIEYSQKGGVEQSDAVKNQTDALAVKMKENKPEQDVRWIDSLRVDRNNFADVFNRFSYHFSEPQKGVKCLVLEFSSAYVLKGISLEMNYEICKGYPAIRKWIKIRNQGGEWLKISDMVLENLHLAARYSYGTLLTPNSRGIDPSIVAFSDSAASSGIILGSEIPSKLRYLSASGICGYNPSFFEWVIGPGESFESEPIFIYAFSGKNHPTVSAVSTALDRCVETEFHSFLNEKILRRLNSDKNIAPVFCTWTNYSANINDTNMHAAVDIASQIGFRCFQLDAGWSDTGPNGGWAVSSTLPDSNKFRDFSALCDYIQAKNMKTGLWYSVFVNEQQTVKPQSGPPLFSLPLIRRAGGLGLSLCYAESRKKYADEIVFLHNTWHAGYFKQDLSNVCYGDIARGHESRTLKESYLRGLRGLLATQDEIHNRVPGIWLQLSHEIYWETPGPEADIAVLKHADSYHSAPNEYWGAGNRSKPVSAEWKYKPDSLGHKLTEGAFRARKLFYAHRGLPLDRIEVFGAVTTNFRGSLTPEIQDRQVCSWLMGAPLSFSGDLGSLTEENIERYQSRFTMIENLQQKYGIYTCFEFSGVPSPTDEGWHWWGKLNRDGCGAVVVLRGSAGEESRKINIPWVKADEKYLIKALFSGKNLGEFSGKQLQDGALELSLKKYEQDIIEINIISETIWN